MTFSRFKHTATVLISISMMFAASARAQEIPGVAPEPPPSYAMREVGVNLSTSDIGIESTDLSVGSGSFPSKLDLVRTYGVSGMPGLGLPYRRSHNQFNGFGMGGHHNLLVYFTCEACNNGKPDKRIINVTVMLFGRAYHFTGVAATGTNPILAHNDSEGASMRVVDTSQTYWTYEVVTKEGIKATFTDAPGYRYDTAGGRFAKFVEFPNGEFITFKYEPSPFLVYPSDPSLNGTMRLKHVVNSKGYGIRFSYQSVQPSSYILTPNPGASDTSVIISATSFKATSQFSSCYGTNPPVTCATNDGSVELATASYGYNAFGNNYEAALLTSFTDAANSTRRYQYDAGYMRLTGLFNPKNTGSIPSIKIEYLNGMSQVDTTTAGNTFLNFITTEPTSADVNDPSGNGRSYFDLGLIYNIANDTTKDVQWSVPLKITSAAGSVTQFEFSDPVSPNPISVSVTKPNGGTRRYLSAFCAAWPFCQLDPYYKRQPTSFTDELGNLTTYSYDSKGRLIASTDSEGGVISITRDANGNPTETRRKAKPGSGLSDLVATAGYAACNASNAKICNKPTYVIDPNGGRWDYQYDPVSGELQVSLAPADADNVRAVTRYYYTPVPSGPVPVPGGIASPTIYLLSAKDTCLTSTVTGTTVDFSFVCPTGSRISESYNYGAASTYELSSRVVEADGTTETTQFTYDNVGNVTSIDPPRTDVDDRSFVTYDSLRRKVFEVSADPDGAAPLPRQVVRHIYDANGNEIRTEFGTGYQTDGSDFVIVRFTRRTFDEEDRLIKSEEVVP